MIARLGLILGFDWPLGILVPQPVAVVVQARR